MIKSNLSEKKTKGMLSHPIYEIKTIPAPVMVKIEIEFLK